MAVNPLFTPCLLPIFSLLTANPYQTHCRPVPDNTTPFAQIPALPPRLLPPKTTPNITQQTITTRHTSSLPVGGSRGREGDRCKPRGRQEGEGRRKEGLPHHFLSPLLPFPDLYHFPYRTTFRTTFLTLPVDYQHSTLSNDSRRNRLLVGGWQWCGGVVVGGCRVAVALCESREWGRGKGVRDRVGNPP